VAEGDVVNGLYVQNHKKGGRGEKEDKGAQVNPMMVTVDRRKGEGDTRRHSKTALTAWNNWGTVKKEKMKKEKLVTTNGYHPNQRQRN